MAAYDRGYFAVWDVAHGELMVEKRALAGRVTFVNFDIQRGAVISGGEGGSLRFWVGKKLFGNR